MHLHGPDDWTPAEREQALALSESLGIGPESIRVSIREPVQLDDYRERRSQRAVARGEIYFTGLTTLTGQAK